MILSEALLWISDGARSPNRRATHGHDPVMRLILTDTAIVVTVGPLVLAGVSAVAFARGIA